MKKKYLLVGVIIVSLILISGLVFLKHDNKEETEVKEKEKTISQEETKSMLSYTLDGEKTDIKPTKESGYIANKIICENGSNLIWDNTNWEVEIISLESNDVCSVDFTTNENTNGYRVTAATNVDGSIDSLSKATIENGTIIFYTDGLHEIGSVSGCNGVIDDDIITVRNITSNQICNITLTDPKIYRLLSNGKKYVIDNSRIFWAEGMNISQDYKVVSKGETKTGGVIFRTGNDYYFAGNPIDNWVYFADKWWRIIRTNSTEGTRLLYAGTSHDGQDGYINNITYV